MSTIAVNAITDANGGATTTINSVTPNVNNVVGKNLVINGAMQIAQRGTSVACPSSNITYTLDRFLGRPNSSTNTTISQVTDAPSGFQYSARVTRDSGQTGTLTRFETAFETKDIIRLRGQRVTISFYAKAGSGFTPSVLSVLLFEGNGTERARAITGYNSETTLVNSPKTLTTSWQKFTHTTTAQIASDTTQLALQFNVSWSGTAPANDEYFITGVQLEAGSSATEFEHRPYTTELQLCQRYLENIGADNPAALWSGYGATVNYVNWQFKVEKRTTPTISGAVQGTAGGSYVTHALRYTNGSAYAAFGYNGSYSPVYANAEL